MARIFGREDLLKHYREPEVARDYVAERFLLPKNLHVHRKQVAVTNAVLRRQEAGSVLELACGPARITRDIVPPPRALAVDGSEQMLTIAEKELTGSSWRFQQADIFELDLQEKFDAVFTFRFIRHFTTELRRNIYEVISRHLNPGGALVFDAPNVVVEEGFRAKHPDLYPVYDMLWTEQELVEELTAAGFRDISLHPVLKRHGLQRVVSFATKRGAVGLGAGIIALLDRLPGGEPLEWVVACTR